MRVAGVAYVLAWVVGLGVWPMNLGVDASDAKVVATYTGHESVAVTQYLLVEGVAAIALAVVVVALGRAASGWLGRVVVLAVALTVSGVGYLLLNPTLAQAAAVSLPLLLIFVTGTGLTLGRQKQRQGESHLPATFNI